jgi:hypothetical protein
MQSTRGLSANSINTCRNIIKSLKPLKQFNLKNNHSGAKLSKEVFYTLSLSKDNEAARRRLRCSIEDTDIDANNARLKKADWDYRKER